MKDEEEEEAMTKKNKMEKEQYNNSIDRMRRK
jgi:hypothetical protein